MLRTRSVRLQFQLLNNFDQLYKPTYKGVSYITLQTYKKRFWRSKLHKVQYTALNGYRTKHFCRSGKILQNKSFTMILTFEVRIDTNNVWSFAASETCDCPIGYHPTKMKVIGTLHQILKR